MTKKKQTGTGKALATTRSTAIQPARDTMHRMEGGGDLVPVDAIYNVPRIHPRGVGPWSAEADKIAWTDAATGYPCIIRRSPTKGHLCGYVAVPPGHALHGLSDSLVVGFGIEVHGGITYADECEASEPEETSVCHVPFGPQRVHANAAARALDHHDDAWWLGFECDRHGDVQPGSRDHARHHASYDGINERTYKTEGYVYRECVNLAAQLKAIDVGEDPRSVSLSRTDRAYDPSRTEG